jgi:uncharacterized protein (TIGR00369 family)
MTTPRDPDFERRVRDSFLRQQFMATLGATLDVVRAGEVHIGFTHREALVQQHGYLHAGVLASVADSACGYAALSLMEPGVGVLSIEFKINMLAPAVGTHFVAIGRVVRSGRTITVCAAEVRGEGTSPIALMQATMMAVRGKGLSD